MGRPNKRIERRKELLPLIAEAFVELGYRRATTAELARRCQVRENVLYRLWPDKKAMFIAAIDHVFDLSKDIWSDLLRHDTPGATTAERLLLYEAKHQGEFGFHRIVFAGLSETEDPEIRVALRRMFRKFQDFIRRRVGEHRQARGTSWPETSLSAWAIVGLGTATNIARELDLLSPGLRARLMSDVGRLVLDGRDEG